MSLQYLAQRLAGKSIFEMTYLMSSATKNLNSKKQSVLITSGLRWCTHTHTHPFNGSFSGTTRVGRYQKGKTSLDFTEARDSEWQWHQLGHMQVCISLQTDNHASTPPLCFFTGQMPFLPPNQQHQSTEGSLNIISKKTSVC